MLGYASYTSPIGEIYIVINELGVEQIILFEETWQEFLKKHPQVKEDKDKCFEVITQLEEYFCGKRREFSLPLCISGTVFRTKVWDALRTIPYGEVRSYKDIAEQIENPKSVRAIGQANKANPLPILIPCHRVIGKNGDMVGYAGDKIGVKIKLLTLEEQFK